MTRKYLGIHDHKELVRDADSRAVLNVDNAALNKYKQERDFKLKLVKMVNEHEDMKKELAEVKKLLNELLGKIPK
jgi:ABC-type Fe3+-citrate transport system substrate-binding protein